MHYKDIKTLQEVCSLTWNLLPTNKNVRKSTWQCAVAFESAPYKCRDTKKEHTKKETKSAQSRRLDSVRMHEERRKKTITSTQLSSALHEPQIRTTKTHKSMSPPKTRMHTGRSNNSHLEIPPLLPKQPLTFDHPFYRTDVHRYGTKTQITPSQ